MASSAACSTSSLVRAGGTAKRRTVRSAPRSRPQSTSSKDCWRMSAQPEARQNRSRRGAAARSISSNESCSAARAAAKSSIQTGCNSRFPPAGNTTCCAPSTTFAPPGMCGTHEWTRRSTYSDASSKRMAPGCWRTPIPARCTSHSRRAMVARADGTRCGRSGC